MPRTARAIKAGVIYHVLNRGNARMPLFHKDADFDAFEQVLGEGLERYPVDLLTYCLMGNHWHLVLRPRTDEALGRLMGWIGVTHVRRHHAHYHSRGGGHLYQGQFKSFPFWWTERVGRARFAPQNRRKTSRSPGFFRGRHCVDLWLQVV